MRNLGTNRISIRRGRSPALAALCCTALMAAGTMSILSPCLAADKASSSNAASPTNAANSSDPSEPTTMQKIVVRFASPDVDPNSYAAKPRTYYRAGESYGRIEQSLNENSGIQPLVVISAPDQWTINAFNHTGKHSLDDDIPAQAHLPLLPPGQKAFGDLEFGKELEYFKAKGATTSPGPQLNGHKTISYRYAEGDATSEMLVSEDSVPLQISINTPQARNFIEYIEYTSVPYKASLFRLPKDTSITEAPKTDPKHPRAFRVGNEILTEPAAPLTSVNTNKELFTWMTFYYMFPEPSLTVKAIHRFENLGLLDRIGAAPPMCAFFSRIFAQNPTLLPAWVKALNDLQPQNKNGLMAIGLRWTGQPKAIAMAADFEKNGSFEETAIEKSGIEPNTIHLDPAKLGTFAISSPSHLDLLWACFMATGDRHYVEKVISVLPWRKMTDKGLATVTIGGAAEWSLTANAKQHKKVLQICKEVATTQPALKADLDGIIKKVEGK